MAQFKRLGKAKREKNVPFPSQVGEEGDAHSGRDTRTNQELLPSRPRGMDVGSMTWDRTKETIDSHKIDLAGPITGDQNTTELVTATALRCGLTAFKAFVLPADLLGVMRVVASICHSAVASSESLYFNSIRDVYGLDQEELQLMMEKAKVLASHIEGVPSWVVFTQKYFSMWPYYKFHYKGEDLFFAAANWRTPEDTDNYSPLLIAKPEVHDLVISGFIEMVMGVLPQDKEKTVTVIEGENWSLLLDSVLEWDEIYIEDRIKEKITSYLDMFMEDKEWMKDLGLPHKAGLVLAGPPGCGKTSIAKRLVADPRFKAFSIDFGSPDCTNSDLSKLFNVAKRNAPSIVILEDLDRIFGGNAKRAEDGARITMSHLLNTLDGVDSHEGVITLITANRLDLLDEAARRPGRFGLVVKIGLPSAQVREAHLRGLFKRFSFTDKEIGELVAKTEGLSSAYLTETLAMAAASTRSRGSHVVTSKDALEAVEWLQTYSKGSTKKGAGF